MSEWRDEMLKLLAKLTLKREAEFFKLPVEWEAMGLTDYITIIKKPMDLRTVRENLESGEYDTAPDASADVRSIFMNAMSYNKPNSRVYVHAKTMSEFWEASCAALMKGLVDPDKPASAEQLAAFVDKCHRVNAQELGVILKHLDEECPNCLVKRADSNEVEVNVDLIAGRAFRSASALLNSILPDVVLDSRRR